MSKADSALPSRIYPLTLPLAPDEVNGWKGYHIFRGCTSNSVALSCHVSVLIQGRCPHPPHRHAEEEILLLLSGEIDLILPDDKAFKEDRRRRMKAGQFVYYPADFPHTLETVSREPANYLMLKWSDSLRNNVSQLAFGLFTVSEQAEPEAVERVFSSRLVFEGATQCLRKFHCHVSTVAPGGGYDPHTDDYDVAIILLEGEIESLGGNVQDHGVIFYAAGKSHGLRNAGQNTARYIVFEFHGGLQSSFWAKIKDPQQWGHSLARICRS